MKQFTLFRYMGEKIKLSKEPVLISFTTPQKPKSILDTRIPIDIRYCKRITKTRYSLITESKIDLRKLGISSYAVYEPMNVSEEWDCWSCWGCNECDNIKYLKLIAEIKENFPRRRKNNVNAASLSSIWRYYRIRQRNCAYKRLTYKKLKKRQNEHTEENGYTDESYYEL